MLVFKKIYLKYWIIGILVIQALLIANAVRWAFSSEEVFELVHNQPFEYLKMILLFSIKWIWFYSILYVGALGYFKESKNSIVKYNELIKNDIVPLIGYVSLLAIFLIFILGPIENKSWQRFFNISGETPNTFIIIKNTWLIVSLFVSYFITTALGYIAGKESQFKQFSIILIISVWVFIPSIIRIEGYYLEYAYIIFFASSIILIVLSIWELIKANKLESDYYSLSDSFDYKNYFVNKGDIHRKDKYRRTPLFIAARNNDVEMAKYFLSKELFASDYDYEGKTSLHKAILYNSLDVAELFLNEEFVVNYQDTHGNTALFIAAFNNNIQAIKLLIQNYANIDIKNKLGRTALFSAISLNSVDAASLLINNGADISILDNNANSVMDIAKNKIEIIKLLLVSI